MGSRGLRSASAVRGHAGGLVVTAWRGGPQPNLSRLLKGCVVEALAENAARAIGRLLAANGSSDIAELSAALDVRLSSHVIRREDA